MAKIFNDFHFQIFVQMFVFNSDPGPKNNTPFTKNLLVPKMLGLGAISFDKALRHSLGTFCTGTFCHSTGTFGHSTGTFGHSIGTFCHITGTFCHRIGTFYQIIGPLCHVLHRDLPQKRQLPIFI
jgi:hypothetical protein